MSGELISVIIPTYNYAHFVTEAVASALAQTYAHVEVIVVDDGSTDDTRQRLAPYTDQIRYIYQDNQGLSAARNTGIRAARGQWIALLDSDDLWHPRKLEVQLNYLAKHPDIALLAADMPLDLPERWPDIEPVPESVLSVTLDDLVLRTHFAPSSVAIARKCFDQVGYFDTELRSAEDRDMWIRIACLFPVVKLLLPLGWYRIHASNMSRVAVRMEENERKVLRKAFTHVRALHWRPLLKLKTYSYAAYSAAYMYGAARCWFPALTRLVRSFLLWPWPYQRSEVETVLARPKMMVMNLLRMLRLKRPEAIPGAALAGAAGSGQAAENFIHA